MYAAELHSADREIGRLLERVGDDAVIVVASDHGESLGEHGIFYAHKGLHAVNLRVPLIVRAPGLAPTRSDAAVGNLDIAPTIAELVGVPLPGPTAGTSLVPALRGDAVTVRETDVHQNAGNRVVAVRRGDWKLIWPIDPDHPILSGPPRLYDLADDPDERHDVAAEHPERVAALRAAAERWIELGVVEPKDPEHLDDEAIEQLRELGYVVER
jgi:arylsulfatase A-like enzyme